MSWKRMRRESGDFFKAFLAASAVSLATTIIPELSMHIPMLAHWLLQLGAGLGIIKLPKH